MDAVAQITKQGDVYVLDRGTGTPLFPIGRRGAVAGRQYVVSVCGGGKNGAPSGSAIVAFALPN